MEVILMISDSNQDVCALVFEDDSVRVELKMSTEDFYKVTEELYELMDKAKHAKIIQQEEFAAMVEERGNEDDGWFPS